MLALRRTIPVLAVCLLVLVAIGSGLGMFWLWRTYSLYAIVICALLLFGGAGLLPSKGDFSYSAAIGLCIGVFIGSAAGGARFLGGV